MKTNYTLALCFTLLSFTQTTCTSKRAPFDNTNQPITRTEKSTITGHSAGEAANDARGETDFGDTLMAEIYHVAKETKGQTVCSLTAQTLLELCKAKYGFKPKRTYKAEKDHQILDNFEQWAEDNLGQPTTDTQHLLHHFHLTPDHHFILLQTITEEEGNPTMMFLQSYVLEYDLDEGLQGFSNTDCLANAGKTAIEKLRELFRVLESGGEEWLKSGPSLWKDLFHARIEPDPPMQKDLVITVLQSEGQLQ